MHRGNITGLLIGALLGILLLFMLITLLGRGSIQKPEARVLLPPTATPTPTRKPITLLFTGDVMLGRSVERLMLKEGEDYPFARIAHTLADADVAVVNLEGPIPPMHRQTPSGSTLFSFRKEALAPLVRAGVGAVNLANNHTLDYGQEGYEHTLKTLKEVGLMYFGHSSEVGEVSYLKLEKNGREIYLVGFHATQNNFPKESAADIVKTLRADHPDAFIVPQIHWGGRV